MTWKLLFVFILLLGATYIALAFVASKRRDNKFLDLSFWWPFSKEYCQGDAKSICVLGRIIVVVEIVLTAIIIAINN